MPALSPRRSTALGLLWLAVGLSAPADAAPPLEVRAGTTVTREGRGTVRIPSSTGDTFVRLGARLPARRPSLFSTSNDNDRFTLWAELPAAPADRWAYVRLPGRWVMASSSGTGPRPGESVATFELTRAEAVALAKAQGLAVRERVRLGQGLRGTFRMPAGAPVGAPAPVVLRLENAGPTAVRFMNGGRQRGPRDNRFSFEGWRDGEPLPVKQAYDFGGLAGLPELAPGAAFEVTAADLREWLDLSAPGTYRIRCRYEGELFPPGDAPPSWPDGAHQTWDFVVTGELTVTVP